MSRLSSLVLACFVALAAPAAAMTLTSPDIANGGTIAAQFVYTRCGGSNVSPQLSWSGAPKGTRGYVLTVIDQDVKPAKWSHWIVVDLPLSAHGLPRGATMLPGAGRGVASNFGDVTYDGPCPPQGSGTHHYVITIWALPNQSPAIAAGEKATDVEATLSKAAIDKGSITGSVTAP